MRGYALYSKDDSMFALPVGYEYPDKRFVGFDPKDQVFLIKKLSDEQREWLKTNDPKEHDKTKNFIFSGDYYAASIYWNEFTRPTGKPYTQLPGGGGCYKVTRKMDNIVELMHNDTVKRVLDRFFLTNEELFREEVRKTLKNNIKNL